MRTLTALTLIALSLVSTDALAGDWTCECIAQDNTCSLRWGRDNNVRNVAGGTIITRMDKWVSKRAIGHPDGPGSDTSYSGPFAIDAYGNDPKPGEVPTMTNVRIERADNVAKWKCVQEAPEGPPQGESTPVEQLDVTTLDSWGRTSLHWAADKGDEVLVRKLVQAGGNAKQRDAKGDTPFHLAVRKNHVASAKFLLDAGANPNEQSSQDGRPPLHVAVDKRAIDMMNLLLDKGATPTEQSMGAAAVSANLDIIEPMVAKGGDVNIALRILIERKHRSQLDALLAKGHRPNDDVTRVAAASGDTEMLESVLQAGGNATVVLSYAMDQKDAKLATLALAEGASPGDWLGTAVVMEDMALVTAMLDAKAPPQGGMMAAVNTGQIEMAQLLLDRRASAGPAGLIATSASRGDLPMTTLLLDSGADANNGMEPGAENGRTAIVRLLLDRGADGTNGTHMALSSAGGHLGVVDLLLGAGSNPGAGMVPSCKAGHENVLVRLIGAGGDATSKDCMVAAVKANHAHIVTVLAQHEASVDHRVGRKSETLLHIAASNQSYDVTKVLLEAGASVDETDTDGETPLHTAGRKKNNVSVIDLLVRNGADINATNEKGRTVYKVANGGKNKKYFKTAGAQK